MPFGDRTGPMGQGPRTGRGAGFCSGYPVPGYMNPAGWWGGGGRRGGGGRGWRNRFYATGLTGWQRAAGWPAMNAGLPAGAPPGPEEIQSLRDQAAGLQSALEAIRQRLDSIENKAKTE